MQDVLSWWWLVQWDLPDGEVSEQLSLAFPACNLVVEPDQVTFCGPTTRAATRELTGQGQVLAALLQPAATPAFTSSPRQLRDRQILLQAPELQELAHTTPIEDAIPDLSARLVERVGAIPPEGLLANDVARLAATDNTLTTVASLAAAAHISERTLHRVTEHFIGLTPYALIRRRRLQEAAQHIRNHPEASLSEVATTHGFSDQAHLAREFRTTMGWTPSNYRCEL